jgi:hypothetical protein
MSSEAALKARIAELEAQLASVTVAEAVNAKAADAAARTGGARATAGTSKTIESKGKIGGAFTLTQNPAFLAERLAIFDKLRAKHAERVAALPHEKITVKLASGQVRVSVCLFVCLSVWMSVCQDGCLSAAVALSSAYLCQR